MSRKLFAAVALFAGSLVAHADLFTFNFAGGGQSASGVLNANATATTGQFLVTGISGTLTGVTIANLLSSGSFGLNDNLLFRSGSNYIPDANGFSFQLINGIQANVFTLNSPPLNGQFIGRSDGTLAQLTTFQITPVATPEPSSIALLGTGLIGLVAAAKRRMA